MSYHANVTAALHLVNDIMPRVWAHKPEVRLWIVGKDPTPDVQACAARHPGTVVVTGSVPDMRDYLRRATMAVVPVVYGAGIQNKVLEAMACGTPVVTSDKATASLQPGYEHALCVAHDVESFAQAFCVCLSPDRTGAPGQGGSELRRDAPRLECDCGSAGWHLRGRKTYTSPC